MKATHNKIRELLEWYQQCDRSSFPKCPFKLNYWQTVTGDEFFTINGAKIEQIALLLLER